MEIIQQRFITLENLIPATPTIEVKKKIKKIKEVQEVKEVKEVKEDFTEIIHNLTNIFEAQGLQVDLVGCWLWVSGDTRPVKEKLKEHGFRWNKTRGKWYKALDGQYKRGHFKGSFEELKEKYTI